MIAGSSQNLAAPAAPTITQRVAGSNETAITGGGTHFSVVITALNYFGETAAGTATVDTPLTSGNVVDCTITAVPGAQQYNIYVSTNATAGTNAYLQVGTSVQSGVTYTGSQSSNSVGYSPKPDFICDGEGDWCPAASGGRSKLCAFGADVATDGLEFGPSCAGDDASCPSVMRGRLYLPGAIWPGVGAEAGPGLASRNALWASSRKSFSCAGSASFSTRAACHARCRLLARY